MLLDGLFHLSLQVRAPLLRLPRQRIPLQGRYADQHEAQRPDEPVPEQVLPERLRIVIAAEQEGGEACLVL